MTYGYDTVERICRHRYQKKFKYKRKRLSIKNHNVTISNFKLPMSYTLYKNIYLNNIIIIQKIGVVGHPSSLK